MKGLLSSLIQLYESKPNLQCSAFLEDKICTYEKCEGILDNRCHFWEWIELNFKPTILKIFNIESKKINDLELKKIQSLNEMFQSEKFNLGNKNVKNLINFLKRTKTY